MIYKSRMAASMPSLRECKPEHVEDGLQLIKTRDSEAVVNLGMGRAPIDRSPHASGRSVAVRIPGL